MPTGDGLLARLAPAGGLSPRQLAGIAVAAARHGNGVVEMTARGSLQVRGLDAASADAFATAVADLGVTAAAGIPVAASPLAGLDPAARADPRRLVARLRGALDAAFGVDESTGAAGCRLGPKVSVVVEAGGRVRLDDVAADVRLAATGDGRWRLGLAGDAATAAWAGTFDEPGAVDAAVAVLERVAAAGRGARARSVLAEAMAIAEAVGNAGAVGIAGAGGIAGPTEIAEAREKAETKGIAEAKGRQFAAGEACVPSNGSPVPVHHHACAEPPPLPTLPHQGGGFAPSLKEARDLQIHDGNPPPWWGRVGRGGAAGETPGNDGDATGGAPEEDRAAAGEAGAGDAADQPERSARLSGLAAPWLGRFPLADGRTALGVALPFGFATAAALGELAAAAEGADEVRLAPGHGLIFIAAAAPDAPAADLVARMAAPPVADVPARIATPAANEPARSTPARPAANVLARIAALAAARGLVVAPGDPRRGVSACPGAPGCASGLVPARALAPMVAAAAATLVAAGGSVHVSGCAKGCARPGAATLTIVGVDAGCGLVHHGTAAGAAVETVAVADLADAVARHVAALAEQAPGAGQTAASGGAANGETRA